jgi:Glyoxalase/Bleomycin resistance protein/Dioxygenase superfamily
MGGKGRPLLMPAAPRRGDRGRDPRADRQERRRRIFETDDCVGTYERLRDAGVECTQEPTERFDGADCALRDPFGNPLRFTERPAT